MWTPTNEQQVLDAIGQARSQRQTLSVVGNGSKAAYGRPAVNTQALRVAGLSGIVDYQPDELIVTVGPGTPLALLERELGIRRQHLVFEPADWGPLFGTAPHTGTVGGMIAAAISGPRRLKAGAVRDHLLGLRGVSGLGQAFTCGGKVVKNVTGFDLPKLMAGSMGTLAVMTEVTLRVGPIPESEMTLAIHGLDDHAAMALMREAVGSPMDVSAAAHLPGMQPVTYLRLEGPAASVPLRIKALLRDLNTDARAQMIEPTQSQQLWQSIRDVQCFVGSKRPLWRLLLPPNRAALAVAEIARNLPCSVLYDRCGGLVWLESASDEVGESWVRAAASRVQGQATLIRAEGGIRATIPPFHPEPAALGKLSETIKMAFDPLGILEPSRMVRGR